MFTSAFYCIFSRFLGILLNIFGNKNCKTLLISVFNLDYDNTLTTKNLVVTNFGPKSMTITLQHKKFDKSGYSRITVVTFLKITVVTFYLPMVLTFVTTKS